MMNTMYASTTFPFFVISLPYLGGLVNGSILNYIMLEVPIAVKIAVLIIVLIMGTYL